MTDDPCIHVSIVTWFHISFIQYMYILNIENCVVWLLYVLIQWYHLLAWTMDFKRLCNETSCKVNWPSEKKWSWFRRGKGCAMKAFQHIFMILSGPWIFLWVLKVFFHFHEPETKTLSTRRKIQRWRKILVGCPNCFVAYVEQVWHGKTKIWVARLRSFTWTSPAMLVKTKNI